MGIDKTLEVFDDLGSLAAAGVSLAKGGIGLGSLGKIIEVMRSANELVKDVPFALPELMDLDAQESEKIGAAAYKLVKKVLDALKG